MSFDVDFVFADDDPSIDQIEPSHDSYRRRLVLLLFDLSGSMGVTREGRRPVDELNAQIERWLPEVRQKGSGELRHVEFAVLTFGGANVRIHTPSRSIDITEDGEVEAWMCRDNGAFVPAAALQAGGFEAAGTTPMVSALRVAIALGDQRAAALAEAGVTTGQIRLVLFTDGSPNDRHLPRDAWRAVADDLAERRVRRRNQIFAFGVPGSDPRILRALAGDDGYFPLDSFDFVRLLDLILIATSADDPYVDLRAAIENNGDEVAGSAPAP
jgi:uncharacterized protein YegL